MDLDQLDTRRGADNGFDVQIRHPETDKPIGTVITVMGMDSDTYQQKALEHQRGRMQRVAKKGRMAIADPAAMEEQAIELLVAATVSWSGLKKGGEEVPFSAAAAHSIYRDFPWIREQVDEAIHDRANFLPGSSKS